MKIRKPCNLARMYASPDHRTNASSPELRFMEAVCAGRIEEAVSVFRERKLFSDAPPVVDAPYGRFEGLGEIRSFAKGFVPRFRADLAFLTPVVQTVANGRVASEVVVNLVVDGEIEEVPMFVIADLRTPGLLDEVRIYCHFSFVPGLQAYRKPIFPVAHREMGDPGLLTGAVREYYEALHHTPAVDVDRICRVFGPGCKFGGYEPWGHKGNHGDAAELRAGYERMATYIPRCVGMRYETIIDDGRTCVIEWVHIVSRAGQEELGRIAMSGIAAYERGDDGLLCAIRISDYAGYERTIDWSQLPDSKEDAQKINFVEQFPTGVGEKTI
jgi:hypothetical protein